MLYFFNFKFLFVYQQFSRFIYLLLKLCFTFTLFYLDDGARGMPGDRSDPVLGKYIMGNNHKISHKIAFPSE